MTTLNEIEQAIARLPAADKAKLLQSLAQQVSGGFPGIETRPDVCGGEPRIVRTRIPVWLLEQARRLGTSDAELLRIYPTLTLTDLAIAWAYVRTHPDEIDRQIHDNEAA